MNLKEFLKTTPKYIEILGQAGISTIKDFFMYFPKAHEDRSKLIMFRDIISELESVAVKVQVESKSYIFRAGKRIVEIVFVDQQGSKGYGRYFNANYIYSSLNQGDIYILIGKPKLIKGEPVFYFPELVKSIGFENISPIDIFTGGENSGSSEYNVGRIYPVYSEILGIKSGRFAKKIREKHEKVEDYFEEFLPADFVEKYGLMDFPTAVKNIHYPESSQKKSDAIHRIYFDKLLKIQLVSQWNRHEYQSQLHNNFGHGQPVEPDRDLIKSFLKLLPYELTAAQKKSLKHIIEDFHSHKPMMRLLQGDVGSGKTVVAAIGLLYIIKKFGGQGALLAPLQVLADQHYQSLAKILLPLGIRIERLTGTVVASQKEKIKSGLQQGTIDFVVGTHALVQDDIEFKNLQFVVIDEQHKFGVKQRSFFKRFDSPHILQMTATPIPRSLALAFFGEFDVSIINEMPKGRKPIETKIISDTELRKLKPRIMTKINQGQQVFVVTPLIEESEFLENTKHVLQEFEEYCKHYPELKGQIGLLHGKLRPKEKDQVMQDFKNGKTKILVSTTVIEVGVDVPQASIIIINNSERFGLSQLHQLRGRVGRSDIQSYCFLQTAKKTGDSYKKLKAMESTTDGFKLAEIDLQSRGAGELLGTRQSGETDLPLELISNLEFVEKAAEAAMWLIENHPEYVQSEIEKNNLNNSATSIMS